jgi:hypothetical protein
LSLRRPIHPIQEQAQAAELERVNPRHLATCPVIDGPGSYADGPGDILGPRSGPVLVLFQLFCFYHFNLTLSIIMIEKEKSRNFCGNIYFIFLDNGWEISYYRNMRLILGDCLEVMKTLPDKSVDAVITDPPYGMRVISR